VRWTFLNFPQLSSNQEKKKEVEKM